MFHITLLEREYFISNRYGCLGDVKQIPKKGHLPTPELVDVSSKKTHTCWIFDEQMGHRMD